MRNGWQTDIQQVNRFCLPAVLLILFCTSSIPAAAPNDVATQAASLAQSYGFLPPEIYKLDFQTKNLLARDVNNDGLPDLVIVNNLQNRLDVLEQRKNGENEEPASPADTNEIRSDTRLRHRKIQMQRAVASLEITDLNGDGRNDLVYVGEPPALYIDYQGTDSEFSRKRVIDATDVQQNTWMLDFGDLNGDKRTDIAFLGKERMYVAMQRADGRMDDPRPFSVADESASLIRVVDLNGDGRNDIAYMSQDDQFPLRVRFQNQNNQLGPERRFAIDPPLGVTYADIDGKPGKELLVISKLSGRFVVLGLAPAEQDDENPMSQLVVYPFERNGAKAQTDVAVADFDGDGRVDAATCDPYSARITLYRQSPTEGLSLGVGFPAMLGIEQLRAVDVDNDKKVDLLVLSQKENAIGYSRFAENRFSFPANLPTTDQPVGMDIAGAGPNLRVVYIGRKTAGSGSDKYTLRQLGPKVQGETVTWESKGKDVDLAIDGKPSDMRLVDMNGDGKLDVVVFFSFQSPVVFLHDGKEGYDLAKEASQGSLGSFQPGAMFTGSLGDDKPVVLVAQGNFVRNVRLNSDRRWTVLDQYNLPENQAKVAGVVAIDVDSDDEPELAMYDRTSNSIFFLKKRDGVFRSWRQLKAGSFDLRGMRVADFDNDGKNDLLLFDSDKMGIAFAGKKDSVFKRMMAYETDIPQGKLMDMVAGDLNGDKQPDILLLEPLQHYLEILAVTDGKTVRRATRWQVFEEKTFRRGVGGMEPREAIIEDLNNDGLNDIAVLVHDRVLVYLQDTGLTPAGNGTSISKDKVAK